MQFGDAPSRRTDLTLSLLEEGGGARTVVHDPATGKYFRLREVEGSILAGLDGRTSLADIHAQVLRDFPGTRLEPATVVAFAERMQSLGWLQDAAGDPPRRPPLHRRLLFLKIPLLRPQALFSLLQPLLRPFYTRVGLALVLVFVALTGAFSLYSLPELVAHRPAITGWQSLVLLWLGFTLISIPHEFGHGMTCRYFGAKSHSMGFLLMYGLPAFYCDVSGAWTLSSRRQRMLIGWAGLGWQFAAAAVAFWLWRVLEPDTLVAQIAAVMLGACGLTALLNLNPLIRLDGYYLLSDWLGIPNLRQKSFAFWGQRWRNWFLGSPRPSLPRREARIFAWLGALSFAYSAVLFGGLGWWLWTYLTRLWGGFGAALFLALVSMIVGSWWRSRRPAGSQASPTPPPAETDAVADTPPERRKRLMRFPWRLAFTGAVLAVAGWAFWQASWEFTVASPCALEATQRIAVRPKVAGVLASLRFREGDHVACNAVIGTLDTYDLEKQREALLLRIRTAEVERQIIERTVPVMVAQNQVAVAEARQEVQQAQEIVEDRQEVFPERQAAAERRVREARAALDAAERVAERLRHDEREIAAGRLTPGIRAIEEKIAQVRSEMNLTDKQVQRAEFLVSEGALARQRLDIVKTRRETLEKEEASYRSQQAAILKELHEEREDAEAKVRHLRAGYDSTLADQRQIERETRPRKIQVAKQVVETREDALTATRALQQVAEIKRTEAVAKRLDTRAMHAELARINRQIAEATIIAPADGVISTPRLVERLGKHLSEGEALCWLDQTGELQANIYVDEKEIAVIRRRQRVELRLGAYPNRTFEAEVQEIATRAELRDGVESYEVRLSIPNGGSELRPGLRGYAKVYTGRRPLRTVLFHRLNRYIRTEVWTWF